MTQSPFDERLIGAAHQRVAQVADAMLIMLFWRVGHRRWREALQDQRAGNRDQIVPTLSAQLKRHAGRGFLGPNLARIVPLADMFRDENIVATLSRQLGWSRFVVPEYAA